MKILILDIETSPLEVYAWKLHEQYVGLNQIKKDWEVLSWSAKWLDNSKVMYSDRRNGITSKSEKTLLEGMWKLLDEADVIITKNGIRFDAKKLNARFIKHGFKRPSSFQHLDIERVVRRVFGFTSNSLEYITNELCTKYKKLKHNTYPGIELWKECLAGNIKAWKEMEKYNKYDVLSLEELYYIVTPWDSTINFNLFHDGIEEVCKCGSQEYKKKGFAYTVSGKYQRYICNKCGAQTRDNNNLFSKEKRESLRRKV